ncbi:hypothetical protein ACF0H5_015055 [Mactra antiquata]
MEARNVGWILCVFVFANILEVTQAYSCDYYDVYGNLHYLYCGYRGECCGSITARYCCYNTWTIVGGAIGGVAFVIIVASIISCFCCACCPGHQYRTRGTVISTHTGPNYQTMPNTNTPVGGGPYSTKPAGAYTGHPPSYQV